MNVYKSLIGKPAGKRSLEGYIWGKDFWVNCKYMVWKSVDWVHLAHNGWMWLSFLNKITEFRVTQKGNDCGTDYSLLTEDCFRWSFQKIPNTVNSCNRRFLEQWLILALTKSYSAINDSVYKTESLTLRAKTKIIGYAGRGEMFLKNGNFYN